VSADTKIKEHHWHIRLCNPEKSAVAKHSINLSYSIQFQDTRILATRNRCMEHNLREATEIKLHPDK
jgi:hypothetical protein